MRSLDLTVGIATKLNRGHLVHGREALILPVVARSERIETAAGEQFVTIEDSMSNVTASRGVLDPASDHRLPEAELVCRMAMATLPGSQGDWADQKRRGSGTRRSDRVNRGGRWSIKK